MPMLLAGFLLLWLSSILLRGFVRANPAALARMVRKGGGSLALVFASAMMVRGEFNVALLAAGFGFWLLGRQPSWFANFSSPGAGFFGRAQTSARQQSGVRSESLDMVLDQATGMISGRFYAGPFASRGLDDLSRAESVEGYRWCARADPQGARLMEAYFDRRFPGWREAPDFGNGAGRAEPGARPGRAPGMPDHEAYHVLGLAQGASREEIARAHRRLMKQYHPDHGGSTDMAARVNEAKDVLMRRHP